MLHKIPWMPCVQICSKIVNDLIHRAGSTWVGFHHVFFYIKCNVVKHTLTDSPSFTYTLLPSSQTFHISQLLSYAITFQYTCNTETLLLWEIYDHTIWKFRSSNAWLTKTKTKEKEIFCSLGLEWVQLQNSEVWIAVVVVVPYMASALIDFKDFLSGADFYFADFSSFAFLWHLCKPLKTVVHYCKPLHIFAHFCKHTFALIRIPWCRAFGYSCLSSFFFVSKSESKKNELRRLNCSYILRQWWRAQNLY